VKLALKRIGAALFLVALCLTNDATGKATINIYDIIHFKSGNDKEIRAFLQAKCGTTAAISCQKHIEWYQAEMKCITLRVRFFKKRVLWVEIKHDPPVPLSTAFEEIGMQYMAPTQSSGCSWLWTNVYKQIYWVNVFAPCKKDETPESGNIDVVLITPSKARYEDMMKNMK
jgi:hypothetical protein